MTAQVLRKRDLLRKNLVAHTLFERDILGLGASPYVVRLLYSFTSSRHVFLALEWLPGGDLYSLIRAMGCLEEPAARRGARPLPLTMFYSLGARRGIRRLAHGSGPPRF